MSILSLFKMLTDDVLNKAYSVEKCKKTTNIYFYIYIKYIYFTHSIGH